MKIALLSEKYTPDLGGLAISTGRLGHLLDSVGYKVRVFAPSPNLPASEKQTLPSGRVSITRFGAHKRMDDTLVDWFELIVEEYKREPFDLIHAYFLPQAGFVGTYAGKYLNIPSIVSIRGNDIERAAFDPSKFSHVMYALQNANAITTNASELAKKAKAFINREIHLIPNGIDTERFKPMERNEMLAEAIGLTGGKRKEERVESGESQRDASHCKVIGFVGELREKKGLATLLVGYTQVAKEIPVSLLLVGEIREGEDKKLFDEFRALNPEHRIVVTGHVPHKDLPAYYSLMDVFVHPSLRDGMPNAVLEAMACGKAVIAAPVGGVLDVLEDGVNGRFTPVNDAEALAQEIEALLKDEQQRKQLGEQARKTIQTAFTPQRELEANLRIYNALVGK
jgi:glycosyltransferase involved in cell wall biosynthesis